MNSQTWWHLSRASGMVAGAMLIASFTFGVLLATRALKPLDRPAWLLAMHRWISGLAVTGTVLHLVALVADGYVHFGWAEIFVPWASAWKSTAVAVGVIAMYLMLLVQVTSLLMKRLPKRFWRGVHLTSYALVWMVSVHAGLAGTDVDNRVYQVVALVLSIVAVTAAMLRVMVGRGRGAAARAQTVRTQAGRTQGTGDEGPGVIGI